VRSTDVLLIPMIGLETLHLVKCYRLPHGCSSMIEREYVGAISNTTLFYDTTFGTLCDRKGRSLEKKYESACRRLSGMAVYLHKKSCLASAGRHTTASATTVVQTDLTA
jgi:hypothetical protein